MPEGPPINMDVTESEGDEKARQRFINRFEVTKPAIEKLTNLSLGPKEFTQIVDEFNQERALEGLSHKDYLLLDNGRTIGLYWDDNKNVRLGFSLSQKETQDKP